MWLEPVIDRSDSDLVNKTPKAYRNISDVNRIEGNTEHLSLLFNVPVQVKNWNISQFPPVAEYQRIINNANAIKQAVGVISVPAPSLPLNTISKMNDLERILYEAYAIYNRNRQMKIYTGEAYAGDLGVI